MLVDVILVDEKRANVQEVDVEERRSSEARSEVINKAMVLIPLATTRK